jgi:4-amino-4-deoxy-L-arabinose transferase-like glycosyltransferase
MHPSPDVTPPNRTADLTPDRILLADPKESRLESSRNNSWPGWISVVISKMSLRNILVLAAVARLAAVFLLRNFYHPVLWEWAIIVRNLLGGRGYSYYEVSGQAMPTAYMPPAHTLFLAFIFRVFGDGTVLSYLVIQLVNVLMGILLVYLVYRLARIYWSEEVATLSALIIAIHPPFVYMATEIANINFYLPNNVAVVYFLAKYLEEKRKVAYLAAAGALLGLLILFRAETLVLTGILSVLLWAKVRGNVRQIAVFAALAMAVIAPWTVRNYVVFHRFIPTTTAMPIVLWYGHNSQSNGTQRTGWGSSSRVMMPLPPMQAELDSVPPGPQYEIQLHHIYLGEALDFMRSHPGEEVVLLGKKFFYYWTFDMHHPKGANPAYWIPTMGLIGLFWVGVVTQRRELLPRYSLFVTYIVFSMTLALVFHVLPRYRMFVEPLMVPFAATGLLFVCAKLSGAAIPAALLDPVLREKSA